MVKEKESGSHHKFKAFFYHDLQVPPGHGFTYFAYSKNDRLSGCELTCLLKFRKNPKISNKSTKSAEAKLIFLGLRKNVF